MPTLEEDRPEAIRATPKASAAPPPASAARWAWTGPRSLMPVRPVLEAAPGSRPARGGSIYRARIVKVASTIGRVVQGPPIAQVQRGLGHAAMQSSAWPAAVLVDERPRYVA